MLVKECPKCHKLIPYGRPYCPDCQKLVEEARARRLAQGRGPADRRYNARRDPKYTAFYRGAAWKKLARARIQADGYKCKICGGWATEVDHIVPIQTADGWERRFDWDNLQSLCVRCHNAKHDRFQKKNKRTRSSQPTGS